MTQALILAGGKISEDLRALTGVDNRALISLGDRTMLQRVVTALRASPGVSTVTVVGNVPSAPDYTQVNPGQSLVDNLLIGLHAAGAGSSNTRVLVSTADIPFLTPNAVTDFLTRAHSADADLCYPVVPLQKCLDTYPGMKRTALKLREGVYTGGNLMLLNPRALLAHQATIQQAFAARKSPLKLGQMLGWGLLGKIILAQTCIPSVLTISALEAGVSRLLGCRAAAIPTDYAEIGTDVDKPSDLEIAQRHFKTIAA